MKNNQLKHTCACITDTSKSPHASLKPVGLDQVSMGAGFWQERRMVNSDQTLAAIGDFNRRSGRIENLRRAAGLSEGRFEGRFFNDSDVYKWMEAAFWSLSDKPDSALEEELDEIIAVIAKAQCDDGYINSYYQDGKMDQRWTDFSMHELYCGGHLIQAAIADVRVRGKTALLDVACRFADHIVDRFGSGEIYGAPGHQLIEMALVELYRQTGRIAYLDLAQLFVAARGAGQVHLGDEIGWKDASYHQDHTPLVEADKMAGHAVRQVYYLSGATDCVLETDDGPTSEALDRLWQNMVQSHLYLGGGIGPRWEVEGFGADYELPRHHAHCESCASVGNFMWCWRMLLKTGDGRFADLCEHILYNSAISGVSLDGKAFYYQNPLGDRGGHRRQEWFDVACCPSNIARLLAQLPGYMVSEREAGAMVHFYAGMDASVERSGEAPIDLSIKTLYPADGHVSIVVGTAGSYPLWLRIPDWSSSHASCTVNGEKMPISLSSGYLKLDRDWKDGDEIILGFDMVPRQIYADERAHDLVGRVAVMRGPVVYCWEQHDNPDLDIHLLGLSKHADIQLASDEDRIGGLPLLQAEMTIPKDPQKSGPLYHIEAGHPVRKAVKAKAIPYAFWANRSQGSMEVWVQSDS